MTDKSAKPEGGTDDAKLQRVGRLVVDADLTGSEVSDLTKSINKGTKFEARRQTPMRIDVFREVSDER